MGRLSLANLPESQRKRINALKSLQSSQTTLEAEFREEVLALERKYLGLYTPLWQRVRALSPCGMGLLAGKGWANRYATLGMRAMPNSFWAKQWKIIGKC